MFLLNSPFYNAYLQSDLFGKFIFLGLFILSAISWIILIYKIWLSRKLRSLSIYFEERLKQLKENFLNFSAESNEIETEHPYYAIFMILKQKTFELLKKNRFFASAEKQNRQEVYLSGHDINLIEAQLAAAISHEAKKLEKNLFILSTIVTLAPFLGLLGTVWGILVTFSGLQTHSISTANATVLSGLSMALATTVLGLLVAIPALIAYNYLKNNIRNYVKDMENFSQDLITTLEIQYRKVEVE